MLGGRLARSAGVGGTTKLGCPEGPNARGASPWMSKLQFGAVIGRKLETHVPTGAGVSPRPAPASDMVRRSMVRAS
jgi:hypothetical protein